MWRAKIVVTLRSGVLDPQGQAVQSGLGSLGFKNVTDVRMGKYMEFRLQADSEEQAREMVTAMCTRLLANPVMEDYSFSLDQEVK